MKSKNMIMLGVAVACGLVAAIAVAKLSAGGSRVQTVRVLVAREDVPIATKLDEKKLEASFAFIEMNKETVPADAVSDIEMLKGKVLSRTLKAGNTIAPSDITGAKGMEPPAGFKQMSVKISQIDAVAGFALPGSKVDVMFVGKTPTGKVKAGVILRDMLVLAVDTKDRRTEGDSSAVATLSSVSLAVTNKHADLLAKAEDLGKIKLVLRTTTGGADFSGNDKDSEKTLTLEDLMGEKDDVATGPKKEDPKQVMQAFWVAKKDAPKNTLFTKELAEEFFTKNEAVSAPEGAVAHLDEVLGKYLTKDLDKGQTALLSHWSKEPVTEAPVMGMVPPKETPKPLPRHELVITQGGVQKKMIYVEVAEGKFKYVPSERDADTIKREDNKDEKKPD